MQPSRQTFDELVASAMDKSFDEWTDDEREAVMRYNAQQGPQEPETAPQTPSPAARARAEELERQKAEGRAREAEYIKKLHISSEKEREAKRDMEANPMRYYLDNLSRTYKPMELISIRLGKTDEDHARATMNALHKAYYMVAKERNYQVDVDDPAYRQLIEAVGRWLVAVNKKPGLMLRGSKGRGKTTMLLALSRLIACMPRTDEERLRMEWHSATEIAVMASTDRQSYERLKKERILGIDDLGQEEVEIKDYGTTVRPLVELINSRYDDCRCTIITTNLDDSMLLSAYGEWIYDRLVHEMCNVITLATGQSYRIKK